MIFCCHQIVCRLFWQGDPGGPLVNSDNKLVGIASWLFPCGHGLPDGYAKISHLYDWIEGKIATSKDKGIFVTFWDSFNSF